MPATKCRSLSPWAYNTTISRHRMGSSSLTAWLDRRLFATETPHPLLRLPGLQKRKTRQLCNICVVFLPVLYSFVLAVLVETPLISFFTFVYTAEVKKALSDGTKNNTISQDLKAYLAKSCVGSCEFLQD